MTGSLLLFSLGPIQDFIASARRCQDLWFGSHLLGALAWKAAEAAHEAVGAEAVVFPGVEAEDFAGGEPRIVANKLLVRAESESDALEAAEAMQTAVKGELKARWDQVEDRIDQVKGAAKWLHREPARAQIDDLIEVMWVVVAEAPSYREARQEAERLLAARKNTKAFAPPSWGAEVPKCALDGLRESVIDEAAFPRKTDPATSKLLYDGFRAHPRERLSAVGLLKRHGREDRWRPRFESTSDLAVLPFLEGAAKVPGVPEAYEALRRVVEVQLGDDLPKGIHRAPGELFFESRLEAFAEERGAGIKERDEVQMAVRAMMKVAREGGLRPSEPIPYFALLMADGDRMGKAIDRAGSFLEHRALSRALTGFASDVAGIVEDTGGSSIYAGGDDVLALVPLHRVLDCAEQLKDRFRSAMAEFGAEGERPTLSVGVAIGHHLDPMDQARRNAKRAESLAKQGRNALAIVVDKRSGPLVEVSGSWEEKDPLHERLGWMAGLHREDKISDKAAFELAALDRLIDPQKDRKTQLEELRGVMQAQLRRTLVRKQPEHGAQQRLEDEVEERLTRLGAPDPAALGRELQIARLFADATRQEAGATKGQEEVQA